MLYHAVIIKNKTLDDQFAVVRPATDGITDTEWYHGCRLFDEPIKSEMKLRRIVEMSYCLVNLDEWNNILSSLDDPGVINNNSFISTNVKPDKWDPQREIY